MENKKVKKPKSKARKIIEWVATGILGVVFLFASVCNISKWVTANGNDFGKGDAFGFSSYIVLTDSMEPVYPVDSAIITYKAKPEKIVEEFNEIKDLNLDKLDERNINLTFVDAYDKSVKSSYAQYNQQTPITSNLSTKEYVVMTHQLFEVRVRDDVEEGQGKYLFFVHGINTEGHLSGEGQYQVFTEHELLGVVKMKSNFIGGVSGFLSSLWGLFICLLIPCLYIVITSVLDIFKAYHSNDDEELAAEGANGAAQNGSKVENMSQEDYEKLKQEMINEMLNGKDSKGKNE